MAKQLHHPSSHAADVKFERHMENNWSFGQSVDLPASQLASKKTLGTVHSSLVFLKNMRNYGSRIVTRSGSRRMWSTKYPLKTLVLGTYTGTTSITGHTRTITLASGGDSGGFILVADWILFPSGLYERVIARTSANSINTRTYATTNADATLSSPIQVQARNNGRWFFTKFKMQLLHLGNDLWVSDNKCTSWSLCVRNCFDVLPNAKSRAVVYNNMVYIGVQGMIFRADMSNAPPTVPVYFRINTIVPNSIPYMTYSSPVYPTQPPSPDCMSNYTYTMTRLSGTGDRNRNTAGVSIEAETPSLQWNGTADYVQALQMVASGTYSQIRNFSVPMDPATGSRETRFTHFSMYRTFRYPAPGILNSTLVSDPNLFVWVADIPIIRVLAATMAVSGSPGTGTATITATTGIFYNSDIGRFLQFSNGQVALITSITAPTTAVVGVGSIWTGGAIVSATIATFGTYISSVNTARTCSMSGTTTLTKTSGTSWSAADVGKRMFCSDGDELIVTAYLSPTTVSVHKAATKTGVIVYGDFLSGNEFFTDTLQDNSTTGGDDLAAHGGWVLQNRRFMPIPGGDILLIAAGKFFAAMSGTDMLNYLTIKDEYEYLFGYFYPKQYIQVDSIINAIKDYASTLLIYEADQIDQAPLSSDTQIADDTIGLYYGVMPAKTSFSENIGLGHPSLIVHADDGFSYFLDKKMKLHRTNGASFNADLGDGLYNSRLSELKNAALLSWDADNGLIIQGTTGITSE